MQDYAFALQFYSNDDGLVCGIILCYIGFENNSSVPETPNTFPAFQLCGPIRRLATSAVILGRALVGPPRSSWLELSPDFLTAHRRSPRETNTTTAALN
ncbi:hypothetical protein H634G_04493 [Metarhizium anisopliae BRIP 53293]|uniref:Uncharacterized protein n=1 Tax=Metarhizium anisopliae BRIP 53293 TaxID=1291518 RepID=A0A0D9P200_METAN|nr:hypothetical protein H634G_04493 [Metarhizium anisopliae BRIP 53293]KJK86651.1 hypothetical protein H633G_09491 [Metarhizium anisopliae BRIP 53284]